jgi:hypothetical protein
VRDVLEQDPPTPSRGRWILSALAAIGLAAVLVVRLTSGADDPIAAPPPAPTDEPALPSSGPVRADPRQLIDAAPASIRSIELVTASRNALFHGPLGGALGLTTLTGDMPYASDDVVVQPSGTGVVVGPAPGAASPGTVRVVGTAPRGPTEPVAGLVPALGGVGYWIMDTATTPAGACRMRFVGPDGRIGADTVTYPCDFVPERETSAGFTGRVGPRVEPTSGHLLDPATGTTSPIGGSLLGSSDRLAVHWSRGPADPLVVEDLVSGDAVDVQLPPGRVRQVAISADDRYLAVVVVEQLLTVRSYEVWVRDLVEGDAHVASVTTLAGSPLELAWQGGVLVVVGDDVEAYDTATGVLYRSTLEPISSRLVAAALPGPLR